MTDRVGNIPIAALGGECVTAQHLEILSAIARGENPVIVPMMRIKLVREFGVLCAAEAPRPIRLRPGYLRAPAPRRHRLTDLGWAVLVELGLAETPAFDHFDFEGDTLP